MTAPAHAPLTDTRRSPNAALSGVGLTDVKWTDGFWAERFRRVAEVSVPSMGRLFQQTERQKYLGNFEVAAGLTEGRYRGPKWNDGDYYKWLEAVAAVYAVTRDATLDTLMDESIALIARVQSKDGYIHTPVLIGEQAAAPGTAAAPRFGDPLHFEMYNMGHLITAACVHHRATGKTNFLQVAIKVADFLDQHYANPTSEHARHGVCPSHLMGLVELYRTTGDEKHLRTAERLVEMREKVIKGDDDNQDRLPLRQHTTAHGHAVRGTYLYAGVADIYSENGDATLLEPITKVWDDLVRTKLYITGGCGALFDGTSPDGVEDQASITRVHQAFGRSYQLPMATAHNETCAAVGNAMWNWRMFLITGDAKYADLLEWTLYNSVLAGVSLDGDKYFYTNALRRTADEPHKLRMGRERQPFFSWFCCPPNAVRMLAESSSYAYAMSDDAVTVVMYGSNTLRTTLPGGAEVQLTQETNYPWDGKVRITNHSVGDDWALRLRVPGWCKSVRLSCNGKPFHNTTDALGFIEIRSDWSDGDVIELDFGMPVRFVEANAHVEEARNHVAVVRGPIVYCLESPDLPAGVKLPEVCVPLTAALSPAMGSGELNGIGVLTGQLTARPSERWPAGHLYRDAAPEPHVPVDVRLIPYFAWGNRGTTEMSVWLPRLG